jgi:hypothetical protein
MSLLTSVALAASGSAAVFGAFYKFFSVFEEVASDEIKAPLSMWLQQLKIPDAGGVLSKNVVYAFNSLFGKRQFSLQCIGRVALFSTIAMFISLIALRAWRPMFMTEHCWGTAFSSNGGLLAVVEELKFNAEEELKFDVPPPCMMEDVTGEAAKSLLTFFVLINLPIDYVAVGITRTLLRGLRRFQLSWIKTLSFLGFDVVAKCILLVGAVMVIAKIDPGTSLDFMVGVVYNYGLRGPVARASFLAMLISSLWIWMYNLVLLAFGSKRGSAVFNWLRRAFNIREHPIQSAGFVAALLSAIVAFPITLILQA